MRRQRSIHTALIFRLVLISAAIAATLGTTSYLLQMSTVEETVAERATLSAQMFQWLIMDHLDAPGLGNHATLQRTIERVAGGRTKPREGRFVLVRILDRNFKTVAAWNDRTDSHLAAVKDYAEKSLNHAALARSGSWQEVGQLGKTMVIHLGAELRNSAEARVGYIEGVFVMAPEVVAAARWKAAIAIAMVIGIVFLTSLILYPVILRLLRNVTALSANLLHANTELLNVLGSAIAKRDSDTDAHNYRVSIYAVRLAEAMGLGAAEIRSLLKGAFLHDVGKIGVRDAILRKPGPLTPEEFEEMKAHVRYGREIIAGAAWLKDAAPVVGGHHEKYDGSGYDGCLRDGSIPRIARIFAVADVFDALTSKRPYKAPLEFRETLKILGDARGKHFDPEVIDAFVKVAPSLHDAYANRDDETLRGELREIMDRYYARDLVNYLAPQVAPNVP